MERPPLGPGELIVEVRATHPCAGFSGIVIANATSAEPAPGAEVFGLLPAGCRSGRLVVCRAELVTRKPAALEHSEAALLASAGTLALRAARLARALPRQRVMITGASGETGALVLQIARALGSHVTGVCRERDVPLVWDIGADDVRAPERSPDGSQRFAAVIDTDGSVTPEDCSALLETGGRLVSIDGRAIRLEATAGSPGDENQVDAVDAADLRELAELVERHGVFPVRPR